MEIYSFQLFSVNTQELTHVENIAELETKGSEER